MQVSVIQQLETITKCFMSSGCLDVSQEKFDLQDGFDFIFELFTFTGILQAPFVQSNLQ